jgi:beta-lactamase regulating signal transducer with metallopeptidase domain
MTWHLAFCTWLAHAALASLVLLCAGCLAVCLCRQPVRRLYLIELTLVGCLLAPWLSQLPGLPHWSVGWLTLPHEEATPAITPVEDVAAGPTFAQPPGPTPAVVESGAAANARAASASGPAAGVKLAADAHAPSARPAPSDAAPATASGSLPAAPLVIVLAYAAVALGLGLWWLVGLVELIRLQVAACPAPPAVADLFRRLAGPAGDGVQLLVSDRVELPITFCFWRPVILLPDALCRGDDPAAVRYCLAHEWSHVARRDLWMWYLATLAQFVFFYQPLLWWLRRQLRLCQDFVADACAAAQAPSAEDYAAYLVGLARRRLALTAPAALGIGDRRSNLSRRVIMLIQNRQPLERRLGLWSLGSTVAAVALLLLVAGVRLDARDTPSPKDEAKKEAPKDEAKTAKSFTYTGEVVEKKTNKPIAGATVTVRRTLYGDPTVQESERLIQETKHTTNAQGKFTFTIPPEQAAKRYLYIELDVTHPKYAPRTGFGYSFAMIQKNEKMGGRPFFEHTELWPGEELSGQVQTPDGKPAAGVKVLTFSTGAAGSKDFNDFGSFGYGKTDAHGVFHVTVAKGGKAVFWLLPKDYAPSVHGMKKPGDLGIFGLKEGIRLRGKVVDVKGKPVAGVYVNADRRPGPGGDDELMGLPVASSIRRGALTNAKGEFELMPLPPGTYRVTPNEYDEEPSRDGRAPKRPLPAVFLPTQVTLTEGEKPEPVEVRAVPHVTVEAQYLDSKGKPTRGHDCFIWGRIDNEFWNSMAKAGPDGKMIAKLPHGLTQVTLDLVTNEHGALRYRLKPNGPLLNNRRVDLGTLNDDVKGIEIIRYTAPIVIVKVVARDGGKLKNVAVTGDYPPGKGKNDGKFIVKGGLNTDVIFEEQEDGRFRSEQLFPDEAVTLTAHADGYNTASKDIKLPEGATKEITITLEKK